MKANMKMVAVKGGNNGRGSKVMKLKTAQQEESNTMVSICKYDEDVEAPLWHTYSQDRSNPLPAYISLNCQTGRLSGGCGAGDSVPLEVWQGKERRYDITQSLSAAKLNDLFAEIAPLAQRVVNGYDSIWNGNEYFAEFTADAKKAEMKIITIIDSYEDDILVCNVDDYLNECDVTDFWNRQTLDEAVAEQEATVGPNVVVKGCFENFLIRNALESLECNPDLLNRNHIKTLWSRGDITYSQVRLWIRDIA